MDIEEIRDSNTIKFPRAIDLGESVEFISYLAKGLHAIIGYRASYKVSLNGLGEDTSKRDENVEIECKVHALFEGDVISSSFHLKCSEDTPDLESIMLNSVPGWKLPDYNPKLREFRNNTRNLVRQYFKPD